ncbi:MAG: GTP-binding protein YchF [Amphiamblys sp. WSBS2006]|nr:MAG: GTP-binding protein YchF [Amphiamblys sp. WSBS2006]
MKQKEVAEEKLFFGRVSNNLKMGIVGLPNVGKSTFFNVLTKSSVRAENFPFCTIDPEESRVSVPDERFAWLCEQYKPASQKPAYLTVVDIAGLVRGASTGAGLGNDFLSHIQAVDGIFHVVRAFKDADVVHVEGGVDPVRDMEIISTELRMKDESVIAKALESARRQIVTKQHDKERVADLATLEKAHLALSSGKDIRKQEWGGREISFLNQYQLLTAKEVVFLVNVSESDFVSKKNKWLGKIAGWVEENHEGAKKILFSGDYEQSHSGEASPTIAKIIETGYQTLNLCHFFTAGPDEVRSWTIRRGMKAPQAAGVIHTDFERGFIMAEVMKYLDVKEHGTEANVRAAGKYYQKGRLYVVEDGDVILFKFNVGGKKK